MQHLSTTFYILNSMVSLKKKRSCEIEPIKFVHGIAFNMLAGVRNYVVVMELAE